MKPPTPEAWIDEAYWRHRCARAEGALVATNATLTDMRCTLATLRRELARVCRQRNVFDKRIQDMTTLPLQAASARLKGIAKLHRGER